MKLGLETQFRDSHYPPTHDTSRDAGRAIESDDSGAAAIQAQRVRFVRTLTARR